MGGAALFFGDQYLAATGANSVLFLVIGSTILTNGIPEAILSALLSAALILPLQKIVRHGG